MAETQGERRLRQQRELVHGSGAPAGLLRVLAPPSKQPARRHWREMGPAERVSMCWLLVFSVVGVLLMAYFFWRIGGAILVAVFVLLVVGSLWNGRRYQRRVQATWARNGSSDDGETAR